MSGLTRDGTAEPVSRDPLTRERGQGKNRFPCPANREQDWQPSPVDTQAVKCNAYTYQYNLRYIHTYIMPMVKLYQVLMSRYYRLHVLMYFFMYYTILYYTILYNVFEGTLVIGLILRSLWGLYKIHETLWFYLVSL